MATHPEAWRFLATLLDKADQDLEPTAAEIGAEIGLDQAEATMVMNQLIRRDLAEINEKAIRRMADGLADRPLIITKAGVAAANLGQIKG